MRALPRWGGGGGDGQQQIFLILGCFLGSFPLLLAKPGLLFVQPYKVPWVPKLRPRPAPFLLKSPQIMVQTAQMVQSQPRGEPIRR